VLRPSDSTTGAAPRRVGDVTEDTVPTEWQESRRLQPTIANGRYGRGTEPACEGRFESCSSVDHNARLGRQDRATDVA